MECRHCGCANSDLEERCRRCGRRLVPKAMFPVAGALAAAAEPAPDTQEFTLPPQPALFSGRPASKIIPFESISNPAYLAVPPPSKPARAQAAAASASPSGSVSRPPARPPVRKQSKPAQSKPAQRAPSVQPALDFLPAGSSTPRTLRTNVQAVIFCDSPVATPIHRCVAAAADLSLILIAFGIFLATFHLAGGEFELNQYTIPVFGGVLAIFTLSYGLVWVLGGSETPGMHWAHLHFVNFDGFPPGRKERVVRFMASLLGFGALGLGVLWALVDEESLTWQDHISKTFPTLRETDTRFVRRP